MSKTSLTDTQLVILSAAAQRDNLRIEFPERLRGGAAKAVLATLLNQSLIEIDRSVVRPDDYMRDEDDLPQFRISRGGLVALGLESEEEQEAAEEAADRSCADVQPSTDITDAAPGASISIAAPRADTKLAKVIALLERENGARLEDLTEATGWLPHTIRAALTGVRKRGFVIERTKREDGATIYRIVSPEAGEATGEAL